MQFTVLVATSGHRSYSTIICQMMEDAAKLRGTGIAKREPSYIETKMDEGKAVIAFDGDLVVGFCYIETWEGKKYVANSGLIVHPEYRKTGLARAIKKAVFDLSKEKYPNSLLFGITTSLPVMKINSDLGYKPVTFSELTQDDAFWKGCQSCVNHDVLQRTNRTMCLCTGMMCDLSKVPAKSDIKADQKAWDSFKGFMKQRGQRIQRKLDIFPFLKPALKSIPDEKQ